MGRAFKRPLYFSQAKHLASLSMGHFKIYSTNYWFFYCIQLEQRYGTTSFFFLHIVDVHQYVFPFCAHWQTVCTTFSPNGSALVMWGIASAKGTMIVDNVVVSFNVAPLGFFVPKLWCNCKRCPGMHASRTYRSGPLKLHEWCAMQNKTSTFSRVTTLCPWASMCILGWTSNFFVNHIWNSTNHTSC